MKFSPSRIKVGLELTSKCNLRCGMCPLPVLRRPYEDMPWELVEKAEWEIHGLGLRLKWLHEMGEPLLYSRIDDAIRLFPEASLSTNGLVLTPEVGAKLLASPLRRLRICVDSIDPKIYPQIRTGGDFDKLVDLTRKFLVQAKGSNLRIEIQKMRSRLTIGETVDDFKRVFERDYARAVIIIPEDFSRDLRRGRSTPVQALVDATDTNTATQVRGLIRIIGGDALEAIVQPELGRDREVAADAQRPAEALVADDREVARIAGVSAVGLQHAGVAEVVLGVGEQQRGAGHPGAAEEGRIQKAQAQVPLSARARRHVSRAT